MQRKRACPLQGSLDISGISTMSVQLYIYFLLDRKSEAMYRRLITRLSIPLIKEKQKCGIIADPSDPLYPMVRSK